MKTSCLTLLLLFSFLSVSLAQPKRSIFFNTGYAWNTSIQLNGETVEASKGYLLNLGYSYRFFTRKHLFSEIGISGKSIFASGIVKDDGFRATTFRLTLPIKLVLPILAKKILFSSGLILQNNVDFREFDFRLRDKYAWRADARFETRFLLPNQFYLMLGFNWNLRNIPDPYFINDPKMALSIGIQHPLNFTRKKS